MDRRRDSFKSHQRDVIPENALHYSIAYLLNLYWNSLLSGLVSDRTRRLAVLIFDIYLSYMLIGGRRPTSDIPEPGRLKLVVMQVTEDEVFTIASCPDYCVRYS